MTESENNRIKELTDRFFEGETTVEEERELYALYLEEDIPEEMEEYREMFRDFSAIIMTEEEKSLRPSTAHPVQETLPTNTHRLTAVKGKTRHKLLWGPENNRTPVGRLPAAFGINHCSWKLPNMVAITSLAQGFRL